MTEDCISASLAGVEVASGISKPVMRDWLLLGQYEGLSPYTFGSLSRRVYLSRIIRIVAGETGIDEAMIKSRKMARRYSIPRQMCMYLARRLTGLSYPQIGAGLGGKDHTTAMYGVASFGMRLEASADLRELTTRCQEKIVNV